MLATKVHRKQQIKSPLNYIGGKTKLLPQLLPLFPREINNFVDLFCGGCNVGINTEAKKLFFNDNLIFLIDMYKAFIDNSLNKTLWHIDSRISKFELSLTNENGYKELRNTYNSEKNPLDLFVLVAFSFNHQIRFNNNHEFNNPFGRERSCYNPAMKENLINFIICLKENEVNFEAKDFENYDFTNLKSDDFVYCDPPYLITCGTYNDGKRGFKGWSEKEEKNLLCKLDELDKRNIKFALSNVLEHKEKENVILKNWVLKNDYHVNYLNYDYSNCNYQVKDKEKSVEVLITNYEPSKQEQEYSLFDF
ncbi:MAG: Dam family site-specific DNA-(adenine-N6)-methyltransferase [Prevotellaceae bacterium]|jgi:DNA adenine methylase|nr:Dam family site-specific DNA-(adenine-N6)-methyltransferase [Prevotellaceae bacterium]